ncbi:hypothetical protein D3C84_504050 [compost metagenome]
MLDRVVQAGGNDPGRTAGDLAVLVDLRQGDKTQLGVAGGDELVGLADVLAFNDLVLDLVGQTFPGQYLGRRQAIRRGFGVGDGQVLVFVLFQHIALGIDVAFLGRPQRQRTDRVGEARTLDGVAFGFKFFRGAVVCREEHFERRAVFDLGVELAGGAKGGDQFMPGVFFEISGDGLDGRGEVGGDSHLDFVRLG